ncbi:unnamed protein product [Closterium sp. NIES-53]
MASLRVLAFDHEGRPIQFDTWLDDLQLYLLSDSRDSVSLFDHTSGAAPAPPATADSATCSQWHTRDAAARLANRNHLPPSPPAPPVFRAVSLCHRRGPGTTFSPSSSCPHWSADASWIDDSATQRSSQGYTFSLGSGSLSWRSTRSSSVLSSSCEAEIYAGAMGAQELRWLTYLLTDLGEQPRLPLVLYVYNKAMIALCQEHRLEHKTKHIALRYFLA